MDIGFKGKGDDIAILVILTMGLGYLIAGIWGAIIGVIMLVCLSLIVWKRQEIQAQITTYKEQHKPVIEVPQKLTHTIPLGQCKGQPVCQPMAHLGHIFVAVMTRYGKTVLLYSWIHHLLQNNTPKELLIGFSDAKRVSFNIYGQVKHLYAPIAFTQEETNQLLDMAYQEMMARLALFTEHHTKMCTNIAQYEELTGKVLPRILLIFDELADSIEVDSQAEKVMTSLAKMGLATGIHLILCTQRPTKPAISHEIQSQCATMCCTYMKSSQEYQIAKVPAEVYRNMRPEKGRFMVYTPETAAFFLQVFPKYQGWGLIQSDYIKDSTLEKEAKNHKSQTLVQWPPLPIAPPKEWKEMSSPEKLSTLQQMFSTKPTSDEVVAEFGISNATAKSWITKAFPPKGLDLDYE